MTSEKQLYFEKSNKAPLFLFVIQVLKGLGQIMLQENAWTGLLFLIGISYGSPTMGVSALLATCCGIITARIWKLNSTDIDNGLYGFSAALTGAACMLFFKPTLGVWMLVMIGGGLATVLQHYFIRRKLPVFTLPFVLITWFFLFLIGRYFPSLLAVPQVLAISESNHFDFAIKGYGQVIFQGNMLSGMLFFIAVFISSPIAALYGLAGGIFSGILSQYLPVPPESIANGLFSFNAVLCAITFSGVKVQDGVWVLLAVLLSLSISFLFVQFNLPQLTFPFVLASFITVLARRKEPAL